MGEAGTAVAAADLARLDAAAAQAGVELRPDVPVAPLTTLRVGGAADRFAEAHAAAELLTLLRLAREARVPSFVLGNGSDIVVADAGLRGLVIRNRAREVSIDETSLRAEAGAPMAMLVKRCTTDGLA